MAKICAAGCNCHPVETPVPTGEEGEKKQMRYRKLIHTLATKYASLRDFRGK